MSRTKLPEFTTVIALAEQTDCRVSLIDLARMHKHGEYSEQAVDALWPDAHPRAKAAYLGLKRYEGRPHNRCGNTDRLVSNRSCVVCHVKHMRGKYAARPELKKAENARWYQQNKQYKCLATKARRERIREQQPC